MSSLAIYAKDLSCEYNASASMRDYTTFKVGGPAELFEVADGDTLAALRSRLQADAVPYRILGSGSNLLVADEGLQGAVIRLDPKCAAVTRVDETTVRCEAGVPLAKLSRTVQQWGLSGMEFACGIPGSVGGGIYMNAGAYGGEMKDVIQSVTVLFPDGTCREVDNADMQFRYRYSELMQNGGIALSATLSLIPGDGEAIHQRMAELLTARREKQPLEYPSAGSFFKRPGDGLYASKLVDDCGLRGYRVGDAQVSEKHAGFVINRGNATCEQLKQLEKDVRTHVFEQTGVTLSPEVRLLGTSWFE